MTTAAFGNLRSQTDLAAQRQMAVLSLSAGRGGDSDALPNILSYIHSNKK